MLKPKNYISIAIFLVILGLNYLVGSFSHISTNLQSILSCSEKKELLKKFDEFSISKKLFIYVDGLDKSSLLKIRSLEKNITQNSAISLDVVKSNSALAKYKSEYFLYQDGIDTLKLKNLDIEKNLATLKESLLKSEFVTIVDKNDPFSILKREQNSTNLYIKNAHLAIKGMGYISIFSINSSINSIDEYEKLYDFLSAFFSNDVKIFSPIFYFVENQNIVKNDVNKIIYLATFILLALYMLILRDLKLLFNALLTLSSSILFALFVLSFMFDEISIFVVVFGISISSVAIDYMFHHYVHREYEGVFRFNKDVFFGMLTTISAFFILSFVSFVLIKELAIFTLFTLMFSYVQFAFVYQKIGFRYSDSINFSFDKFGFIKPKHLLLFIVFIIFVSLYNFRVDLNLKNLDVQNSHLDNLREFFSKNITHSDRVAVLIKAKTLDELITNSKKLKLLAPKSDVALDTLLSKSEFYKKQKELREDELIGLNAKISKLSLEFGFDASYFDEAYRASLIEPIYTLKTLKDMNFEVLETNFGYITYANVLQDDIKSLNKLDFTINLSIKTMFEQELNAAKNELIFYGVLAVVFIVFIVFLGYRKNLANYLIFLFFPFSMILSIVLFTPLNILHIFILFIILSISIDYGIYISSAKKNEDTAKAIIYSILTTFAGFGVLIFSNISALYSIGIAASIGVLSIIFLLIFLKKEKSASNNL